MNTTLQIILIVLSVMFSAFFSGSENCIASANKIRLRMSADEGKRSAKVAQKMADNFSYTISTILMGNNLVNILASTASTMLFVELFPENGEALSTVVMTVILLIFGEIFPKIIAVEYADSLVTLVAYPLRAIMMVFSPVVFAVTKLVDFISPLWTPKKQDDAPTTDELCTMVEEMEEEKSLTERESELIRSAISFTDVNARDVMIPRVDVAAFDIDDGVEALIANKELLQFSRFPVYRETLDNILGILSSRRVIRAAAMGKAIDIEKMLKPALFVHMTRPISSILREFTSQKLQMAVVVDEYGGNMGILTREDIIEEIVGEIYDETDDEEEPEFEEIGMGGYIFDGGLGIEDMFGYIGYTPADFESEYNTVGGWATEMLNKFPDAGDSFEYENLTVTVIEAQSMRVEKLLVVVKNSSEEEN